MAWTKVTVQKGGFGKHRQHAGMVIRVCRSRLKATGITVLKLSCGKVCGGALFGVSRALEKVDLLIDTDPHLSRVAIVAGGTSLRASTNSSGSSRLIAIQSLSEYFGVNPGAISLPCELTEIDGRKALVFDVPSAEVIAKAFPDPAERARNGFDKLSVEGAVRAS